MWRLAYAILTVHLVLGQRSGDIQFPGSSRPRLLRTTTAVPLTARLSDNTTLAVASVETSHIEEETSSISALNDTHFPIQIPLDEIFRLNEITDIDDFEKQFLPTTVLRFGPGDDEDVNPQTLKNLAENPKPAKCEPEMTTVPLQVQDNSFSLIFPSCTRVKRCGGCCNSELLSCQPTEKQDRYFNVYVSEYTNGQLRFNKKDIVVVEEHKKCKCDCKIKKEHCNSLQIYHQKDCRCKCFNQEDRQKCENDNVTKIWDYETCMCRCREATHCSTGYIFDEQTCSCKPEPVLFTRFGPDGEFKRRRRPGSNNADRYGYSATSTQGRQVPVANRKLN